MATIQIQIDDATLERVRKLAETRGRSVEELVQETVAELGRDEIVPNPLWGALADDADVLDEIVEEAMRERERPWRG